MKVFFKVTCCILTIFTIVLFLGIGVFGAVDTYNSNQELDKTVIPGNQVAENKYLSQIKVCANMGNWQMYSENSIEAIEDCETDFISVDVKLTKDKVPVLMKDTTLDRMCVDKSGKTATGELKNKNYSELASLVLRYGNGGSISKISSYKIPTLEEVFDVVGDDTQLIIDTNLADLGIIYQTVLDAEKLGKVVFRLEDCDSRDVRSIINKDARFKNLIIPQYNGNIIFGANNLIKDAVDVGLNIVQIGTKNRNGVILYDSFTKKLQANKIYAIFSFTEEYNADRNDDISGWDNIISCGYSIIETNYPNQLKQYVEQRDEFYSELKSTVQLCENYLKGSFSQKSMDDLNRTYNEAMDCLEHPSSLSEISTAYTDLSNVYNNLQPKENLSSVDSFTFTPGRIVAVVLCLGTFVASQIYLFKKRRK